MRRRAAQQKLRFISWKTKKNRDKTLKNELAAWTMVYKWLENAVAPLAGAWIEIRDINVVSGIANVAPLAGAWIEMDLKLSDSGLNVVAPLAGAWIEMP